MEPYCLWTLICGPLVPFGGSLGLTHRVLGTMALMQRPLVPFGMIGSGAFGPLNFPSFGRKMVGPHPKSYAF